MQNLSMGNANLSVIIATKNEAHNIADCIDSVKFAKEILVLDSASIDLTCSIAQDAGATVYRTDWPGYGAQQLRGISMARCDWVLSLDADERITPELQREIIEALEQVSIDGFRLPRSSSFCGQFIKAGGWTPDYTLRLVRRSKAGFTDHFLHAHMTVDGKKSDLKSPIIHYSYRNLDDVLEKLNRYSRGAAIDAAAKGSQSGLFKAIFKGFWAFFRTYFLRLGFIDGRIGLILALFNGQTTYYKYLRLYFQSLEKK
jgi:glycosyltransferase involved in cell wall biosynthesis